jgi:alpha-N-acetylgalactosaminidase
LFQLIIGGYGLSFNQEKLHMGMWAMMASPLFMSVDLETIRPASKGLLLNKILLSINQDPLGIQGQRLWKVSY